MIIMEKNNKINKIKMAVISAIIAVIAVSFITDAIRTKLYGQPPVFCVKAVTYEDGVSAGYYGAGYKIKRDYDINEKTDKYYITLWILPDCLSL